MSRPSVNGKARVAVVGAPTTAGSRLREALAKHGVPGDQVDLYGGTGGEVVISEYAHPLLDEPLLRITRWAEDLHRLLRDPRDGQTRLGLRHRGLEVVGPAVRHHAGGAPRQEARRLELGLHLHHISLDAAQLEPRCVVTDPHVLARELFEQEVERSSPDADGHRGHDRPARVEGRHGALEPLVARGLRAALLHLRAAE